MSSDATTRGVRVRARPRYHPERSDPVAGEWFFSYTVEIENQSDRAVRLVSRHWVVTDATGHERHVRGDGVVGEQPRLAPGQRFRYTSFCPLPTSLGAMHGAFTMQLDDGQRFDAEIAAFPLVDPATEN
jgi:ApaG protein